MHLDLSSIDLMGFSLPFESLIIITLLAVSYLTVGVLVKSVLFSSLTTLFANYLYILLIVWSSGKVKTTGLPKSEYFEISPYKGIEIADEIPNYFYNIFM